MKQQREIFVFGSNKAGRHGKGAALTALKEYGAIYGLGWGMQGDSYAIPTKGYDLETLSLAEIENYVDGFLRYARSQPRLLFKVTAIGCGLAEYIPEEIAPMFAKAGRNCHLPTVFNQILKRENLV